MPNYYGAQTPSLPSLDNSFDFSPTRPVAQVQTPGLPDAYAGTDISAYSPGVKTDLQIARGLQTGVISNLPEAPGFMETPAGMATIMSFAQVGQAIMNDFVRREQNKANAEYRAQMEQEAQASSVNQLEQQRRGMESADIQARVQTAKINREYLKRRGAAMVRAGVSGVGGVTAQSVLDAEELRQAQVISGIEQTLKAEKMEAGTTSTQQIFTTERQRMHQASTIRPQESTLVPDILGAGLQSLATYQFLQGAQQQGLRAGVDAVS